MKKLVLILLTCNTIFAMRGRRLPFGSICHAPLTYGPFEEELELHYNDTLCADATRYLQLTWPLANKYPNAQDYSDITESADQEKNEKREFLRKEIHMLSLRIGKNIFSGMVPQDFNYFFERRTFDT